MARSSDHDPLRPSDHVDGTPDARPSESSITQPKLGFVGTLRFIWRQLTSMRTALFLLLLLAIAAVPGSLVPQRSSDPNGVVQYFDNNPDLAPFLDSIQMFDVYSSVWFSSIYLLLFVSLIGCVIPRTKHHYDALRARPPKTPARLGRLAGYTERVVSADDARGVTADDAVASATTALRGLGYRVEPYPVVRGASVSAERGYLRETGNLVFHIALLGILVTVGIGGGFGFAGQRVVVEGQSFVNTLSAYDSFNPGRFFQDSELDPYRLELEKLDVEYELMNADAYGQPIDFTANVVIEAQGEDAEQGRVKVNDPLRAHGTDIFLLGNGYAPTVTVRNPEGEVVYSDSIPFLPQDANLYSIGIIKVPDGLAEQVGMVGLFYPTQAEGTSGAYFSSFPDLLYPMLTINVYQGDLGIDGGEPKSVYTLDTDSLEQLSGRGTGVDSIELQPGETADLPNGLGTITFEDARGDAAVDSDYEGSVSRFASLDIHHDPTQGWVLAFAILCIGGLATSLFVPRRRLWVKAFDEADGSLRLEYAGLARGDDPTLVDAVTSLADKHSASLERKVDL
ncbi:cytochrome c biogenesis protein ResB [Agromyces atrinae]|uniref:Cytochrome c biogenesis protein n=2 Tax=Agromyces atrinae TaxID=592376 RepID=A0A852SJL4_9MICO|nr:cytochrome c biogenesis protein ResB [Agromyces atrinae]NYD67369.1 cytochrome c biogenesis protein [Agromyces atrinae]